MASMATTMMKFPAYVIPKVDRLNFLRSTSGNACVIADSTGLKSSYANRLLHSPGKNVFRHAWLPANAVGSGLEGSITDTKGKDLILRDVQVVVESRDDDKMQVRIVLTGESTQKAYDDVLSNLARTAPPIPGFRRMKGGKTSNILGPDRVTKFTVQEIISSATANYVKKGNLQVKNSFSTIQSSEELETSFKPGQEFEFSATIEFEKSDTETNQTTTL